MSNNYWDSIRVSSINFHGVRTVKIVRNERYHWVDIVLQSDNGTEACVNLFSDKTGEYPEVVFETVAAPEPVTAEQPEPVAA